MPFTYQSYILMIQKLITKGFKIASYHNQQDFYPLAILRHDIDFSLDKALEMALIENALGIQSTYFILLSTDFYNIASKKSTDIVRKIHKLGHEIGLHFDEMKYVERGQNLITAIKSELDAMEMLIGIKIISVSMHRPSKETLEADYQIDGIVNSYSKVFFNDFKYISDSRRKWKEDVNAIIDSGEHSRLHILTHPFWYNQEEKSLKQSIVEYINTANLERYNALELNLRDLHEIIEISEVVK